MGYPRPNPGNPRVPCTAHASPSSPVLPAPSSAVAAAPRGSALARHPFPGILGGSGCDAAPAAGDGRAGGGYGRLSSLKSTARAPGRGTTAGADTVGQRARGCVVLRSPAAFWLICSQGAWEQGENGADSDPKPGCGILQSQEMLLPPFSLALKASPGGRGWALCRGKEPAAAGSSPVPGEGKTFTLSTPFTPISAGNGKPRGMREGAATRWTAPPRLRGRTPFRSMAGVGGAHIHPLLTASLLLGNVIPANPPAWEAQPRGVPAARGVF